MEQEKKTKVEPVNDTQNEDKRNEKSINDWEKIAVIVSVIGLVISSLLTAGLTFYSFQLTEQANSIAKQSLDLQNYKPVIVPKTDRIYLENGGYYFNGTTQPVQSSGFFNFSLTVFTPYGGVVRVEIENFTAVDYEDVLEADKINLTQLITDNSYQYRNNDQFAISGLNPLDFSIPLRVFIYLNQEKLQQFSDEVNQFFPVGILYLKATLSDVQNNITTKEFSEIIIAMIRIQDNSL